MSQLGAKDLQEALGFVAEAQAIDDLRAFVSELVPLLRRLVPYDSIGYNEIDLKQGTGLGIVDPPGIRFEGFEERFLAVAAEHPLVVRQQWGDLRARMLSDSLSSRQFHRLELYQHFYKLIDAEDQLAFGFPGEVIVAIALCRSRRTFTERDRQLLELVRPHLALAYNRTRERERTRALIRALDADLEQRNRAVLQLDPRGRLAHASSAAHELLEAYFASECRNGNALPASLRAFIGAVEPNGSRRELTIDGARGRLRVREQPAGAACSWRMLILEEHRACPPSIEALCSLGLTARQAQVLRLLACGKTSRQIGGELQISTATVSKHLEHIYAHLGVSTRAQALARIYA